MINPNDWLINKLAADLGKTTAELLTDDNVKKQIQRYIVAEIETYAELVKALHGKVGA